MQTEIGCLGISPGFVHFRMMVPGIVRDDHDALAGAPAPLPKELQEIPEALPVKSLRLSSINEAPIPQAHRPKVGDALSRGVVQEDRVLIFRRYPQAAPGAVRLKVHLVQRP